MIIPVIDHDRIEPRPPVSRAGDHVVLRALIDVLVMLSACPLAATAINGENRLLRPVHCAARPDPTDHGAGSGWAGPSTAPPSRPCLRPVSHAT